MVTFNEKIASAFEKLDLSFELDAESQTLEISTYSPEGQDCSATFKADYMENLLRDMAEWIYDYDADYQASLWIGDDGHGRNGAPYHLKDIVTDMEWWRDQIDELHDRLCEIDQEREYTYEVCPHCGAEGEFSAKLGVNECPTCGKLIALCSMCESGGVGSCTECKLAKYAQTVNELKARYDNETENL